MADGYRQTRPSKPGLAPGQSVPESPGPSCSFLAQGLVPLSQEETPWNGAGTWPMNSC